MNLSPFSSDEMAGVQVPSLLALTGISSSLFSGMIFKAGSIQCSLKLTDI